MKIKPIDVKTSAVFFAFGVENNNKDPKYQVGDHVRISRYKNVFARGYAPS